MKKLILFLLLITVITSCRNAWNETDEHTFKRACLDDANTWAASPEKAVTYCDCVIAKVKEKYPDENEAMKQVSTLIRDTGMQSCKAQIMAK